MFPDSPSGCSGIRSNLPTFIRKGIEQLCIEGKIKYLVCTSTLLQGVNLPAKNIFIMQPSKGRDEKQENISITATEFWNLAGRAGRLTKDFEGNVYLININDWAVNPLLDHDKRQTIYPSFAEYLCGDDTLIEFITDKKHGSGNQEKQGLENAFMKMVIDMADNRLDTTLDMLGKQLSDIRRTQILEVMQKAMEGITLPYDIIAKNPTVSIYRQQDMFDYFLQRIKEKGAEYVIPPHPMIEWDKIKNDYLRLTRRIHSQFEKIDSRDRSHNYFSNLMLLWMKGVTYYDLLENQIQFKTQNRKRGNPDTNVEARRLFSDIEYNLRFRYVKFTKCHNDILAYALKYLGINDYNIPPIHLFLELGASSNTMISLISMGISRTGSSILAQYAPRTNMDFAEVSNWVKRQNLSQLGLHKALISEVRNVIKA